MKLEEIQELIGKQVIYKNHVKEITGVHVYLNANGVKGVRLHLNGVELYIRLDEAQFFEIIKKHI